MDLRKIQRPFHPLVLWYIFYFLLMAARQDSVMSQEVDREGEGYQQYGSPKGARGIDDWPPQVHTEEYYVRVLQVPQSGPPVWKLVCNTDQKFYEQEVQLTETLVLLYNDKRSVYPLNGYLQSLSADSNKRIDYIRGSCMFIKREVETGDMLNLTKTDMAEWRTPLANLEAVNIDGVPIYQVVDMTFIDDADASSS